MKKILSLLITTALLVTICSPAALAADSKQYAADHGNYLLQNDGVIYEENLTDIVGNDTNIIVEKTNNKLITKTYVNKAQIDTATREILSDGSLSDEVVYIKFDKDVKVQDTQILNVNDYIEVKDTKDTENSVSTRASYPFIKSKYNATWNYVGSLYGACVDTGSLTTRFYFGEDTPTSVIVSFLVGAGFLLLGGIAGLSVAALASAFGSSVVSGVITAIISGYAIQDIDYWEYQVYVLGEYVLFGQIDYVHTTTYNNSNYVTGEFDDVETGGPYDDENSLIDYGVYCYVITH